MKRLLLLLVVGFCCYTLAQTKGIRQGVVQVKLTEQTEFEMRSIAKPLETTIGSLSVGIESVDQVNARFNARKMQRVFHIGGPFEERQRRFGLHLWYEIHIDEGSDVELAVTDYLETGAITIASPDYTVKLIAGNDFVLPLPAMTHNEEVDRAATPNDPSYTQQWHYNNTGQTISKALAGIDIRLPAAWGYTYGNPKVIVAVVDGGIDYDHPDLKDNMWPGIGQNFVPGTGGVTPHRHGTHVAGTIAARTNNGTGVAGVAGGWGSIPGAQLMSCQIFDHSVNTGANTAAAIQFGADNGAVISQNSWGYENPGVYVPAVRTAINYFIQNAGKDNSGNPLPGTPMSGGIVIFSAGNGNSDRTDWYPGMFPEVLTVASVGPTGKRASYSNYGTAIDITAPGGDLGIANPYGGVLSTYPRSDGSYAWIHGTSMACPHVSGVAALVLSRLGSETYTPGMLWERLILATNPIYTESLFMEGAMGTGLIDASRAVLDYAAVENISLPTTTTIYLHRTDTLIPTFQPITATDQRITWQTSDASIVSINAFGMANGRQLGSATITAISNDGNKIASTIVNVVPVPVLGINIIPKELVMRQGSTQVMSVRFTPDDASNQAVTWSTDNASIATVNNTGLVTAVSLGVTKIRVTSQEGSFVDSCVVTVMLPVVGVSVNPVKVGLMVGDACSIIAEITPEEAYDKEVYWTSSNTSVVTVSDVGRIQARKVGTAQVTVRTNDGDYRATCVVDVYDAIKAPQAFSPNNDGINDYFEFVLDSHDTYTLHVFDKSGQMYYQSDNYKNNWDGIANTGPQSGQKVFAGTYFYTLSAKNSGQEKAGYVVIKY